MAWKNPTTVEELDAALDASKLYVAVSRGPRTQAARSWWGCRRNGKTRRWKNDAKRFYIPFKYGLYGYGNIDQDADLTLYRIADSRGEAETKIDELKMLNDYTAADGKGG